MGRHPPGDLGPEVLFHERQGEIEPGRDAGCRPKWTVEEADGIRLDPHLRVAGGQHLRDRPVRRDPPSVQEAGLPEQESSTADRAIAPAAPDRIPEPREQLGSDRSLLHPGGAGHEESVEWRARIVGGDEVRQQAPS
ncbi:hypothetical protein VP06_04935 [Methylobacterium aquaticum]|uniref:Uncharacterized protein n=1 Tax=Methylobacterium aquaticum TaxID=270351 RepID=A0A0J6SVB7_9HYPH|nr:hypothetical protein VP06_04935 [Methylobacterium aquaticum]